MGLETEDGAELFLICAPTQPADVVARLRVRDSDLSVFDVPISLSASDSWVSSIRSALIRAHTL